MSKKIETRESTTLSFRIGDWLVEPRLNRLTRDGDSIQIELKMMDVLVCLAEDAGELVERQQLIDTVWATEFISENILTRAIAELRNALGDDARNPSFIETIHRRGYRLIASIEFLVSDEAATGKVARFPVSERPVTEERSPYPGLSAFTEDDIDFFFGREAEIAQLWRKLTSRRLLAVIGPSGVGKSSLLRAGLLPSAPDAWSVIVCQPGDSPYSALARALAPEFREDPDAIAKLVDIRDDDTAVAVFSRWRGLHDKVLLVIDQFEELFTQNSPEVQERFTILLRRLADQSDVNVLLAMRDDFLIACNDHESLFPIFSDLTPIKTPARTALRRAIVNPASGSGYTFEDENLIDEMLDAVEGEQGALPLLAFTVARLWEERDRERRLMTGEAYERIGGVHGSLALHAETTLAAIGGERHGIVRELFRNLVSSQGTRASREVDDLISVFADRQEASGVLAVLTDARLLNVSEVTDDEGGSHRSVEVVHESLLTSWPRLVRWQTQDADAALVRDQLRQAARTWYEHDRSDDFLWTGRAYREYLVWQENYPGGLSELEEDFSQAMTAHEKRKKRQRRIAVGFFIAALMAVAAATTALWQRSVRQTRRAEAQKLLALGEVELAADPTEAFAWARASLEISDSHEGRLFALRALSKGPIARILDDGDEDVTRSATFSPDGEWVALGGRVNVRVFPRSGGPAVFTDTFPTGGAGVGRFFDTPGRRLVAHKRGEFRVYSLPDFAEIARHRLDTPPRAVRSTDRGVYLVSPDGPSPRVELWKIGSPPELITSAPPWSTFSIHPAGKSVAYVLKSENRQVYLQSLVNPEVPARRVHTQSDAISRVRLHPEREWIAIRGVDSPEITLWTLDGDTDEPLRTIDGRGLNLFGLDRGGTRLVEAGMLDGSPTAIVWGLRQPSEAEPLVLRTKTRGEAVNGFAVEPNGRWLVVANVAVASFWPLPEHPTIVFPGLDGIIYDLAFTPDGDALIVPIMGSNGVRLLPIVGDGRARQLLSGRSYAGVEIDPRGRFAAFAGDEGLVLYPFDGSDAAFLERDEPHSAGAMPIACDPDRDRVAAGVFMGSPGQKVIRVCDLHDGTMRVLGPAEDAGEGYVGGYRSLEFLPDGSLLSASRDGGVRRWNVDDGSAELLLAGNPLDIAVTPDGRTAVVTMGDSGLSVLDLDTTEVRALDIFGDECIGVALSPRGDVLAVSSRDGTIRVGRFTGGEPYILLGHESTVSGLAFSPDGRLLASADWGGTVRVQTVPDLSKPPIHTLPHDELMAKLESFTNLRVVRDDASPTGWKTEIGPFPGWETVPEW